MAAAAVPALPHKAREDPAREARRKAISRPAGPITDPKTGRITGRTNAPITGHPATTIGRPVTTIGAIREIGNEKVN